jgi:hypothetical protein
MKVDLSLSIDGNFKTQAKNRKGITRKAYDKIFRFSEPFFKEITINMAIAPNNVVDFAQNFLYLYKLGARKFNLLPAAYTLWSSDKIKILKAQLDVLGFFIKKNGDVYLENYGFSNSPYFINVGIVIDTNGDIFLTDAILLKQFFKIKDKLRVSNINKISSFSLFKKKETRGEIKKSLNLVDSHTNKSILECHHIIESLLENLITGLKTNQPHPLASFPIKSRVDPHFYIEKYPSSSIRHYFPIVHDE